MLTLQNLCFHYPEKPLLHQISFKITAGGLLHLKGSNGSGKTTLLQLIAGLRSPHQGHILWEDKPISHFLPIYQRQICWVGHKPGFDPYLNFYENCYFNLELTDTSKIESLTAIFHLQEFWDYPCGLLSNGQKKQLSLLKLWMSEAKLWLLDEPMVALDEQSIHILMTKIAAHRANGGMVLLTSHQSLQHHVTDYQEYTL
jgi:heme exporter protein A